MTDQRAALAQRLKALRREALDVCLEIRALDHAARAREPRPGQSAPSNPYATGPLAPARPAPVATDWDEE